MKIASVIGARPQFIKAAMVTRALQTRCNEILIHTGQHYDANMSQLFFDELEIPQPKVHLGVGSGTHAEQTGQMMVGIERALAVEKPDWVLVYGDTNSTLAGALVAAKLNIPLAHVEAGLRSYNRRMPEEINRVVCDHLSQLLFCPSEKSVLCLESEGIVNGVNLVGDVMGDALNFFLALARQKSQIMAKLGLVRGSFAVATVHRVANTDDETRLRSIFYALGKIGQQVVLPVHPRTRKVIETLRLDFPSNVIAIEPLGYLDMLMLESNANCILTDSGGIQKEAFWLGIRCITLRDETEWVETVELGWNRLVGVNPEAILDAVKNWRPSTERPSIYGNGHAAQKIAEIITQS